MLRDVLREQEVCLAQRCLMTLGDCGALLDPELDLNTLVLQSAYCCPCSASRGHQADEDYCRYKRFYP